MVDQVTEDRVREEENAHARQAGQRDESHDIDDTQYAADPGHPHQVRCDRYNPRRHNQSEIGRIQYPDLLP